MPQSDEPIGRVLQATYRLERKIGEGSMGTVYAASHTRLPRRFAVKYLAHEVARRADALARFRREAEVASRIGHPNIVEVVDINSDDEGRPYIVMELLEGEDLEAHLRGRGRLAPDQVLQILQPVASALDAAHAAGVIHRDLKPSNIFLARVAGGALLVKIVDFGISKVLAAQNALTTGDAILGTPYYMAPEQAEGELEAIRAQTDVYALGAILFELLSGQTAITGDSTLRVLYQIVHGPAPSLAKLRPELPAAICETVDRALRKRPEDRHASAGQLADAFAAAVLGSAETRVQAVRPPASSDPEDARQTTVLRPRPELPELPASAIRGAGSGLRLAAVAGVLGVAALAAFLVLRGDGPAALPSAADLGPRLDLARAAPRPDAARPDAARPDAARPDAAARDLPGSPDRGVPIELAPQRPDRKRPPARVRGTPGTARLTIHTELRGRAHWARVALDGRNLGETPIVNQELAAGKHTLRVERAGFRPQRIRIHLKPGETRTVRLGLVEQLP